MPYQLLLPEDGKAFLLTDSESVSIFRVEKTFYPD